MTNTNDFKYLTGVTNIPDSSFRNYAGNVFKFPPNVRTIGNHVLDVGSGSSSTTKMVIVGEQVQSIGEYFCRYESSMQKAIIYATTPPTNTGMIFRRGTAQKLNNTFRIYVPDNSVSAYKSASGWNYYASEILPLSQLSE